MALLSPFSFSNFGSALLQWLLREADNVWTFMNIANGEFANLERDDPILPGVPVVTTTPRNWDIHPDPEFGGFR